VDDRKTESWLSTDEGSKDADPTSEVPFDEKLTASDPLDVQAKVEAAVLATEMDADRDSSDPMLGVVVGDRFEIITRIGIGGMGVVYKAGQAGMDRWVAVKVLLRELSHETSVISRFKIEALAVSRLTHPNTIRIYDFGMTHDNVLYIAMEFLDGRSLDQELRDGPMSARRTLHVIRQIASSLAEAHGKGIVHRDLKPDNIFMISVDGDDDFIKVLDFGVAKLREADKRQATLTQTGVIFGTPRYMAPEQCRSMEVDGRADLYALGVIAYEMLMGRALFDEESPLAILMKHVQAAPPSLRDVRPDIDVPRDVEAMVMKCLEKSPEKRFQTARELATEAGRLEAKHAERYGEVVLTGRTGREPGDVAKSAGDTFIDAGLADDIDVRAESGGGRKAWPWLIGSSLVLGGLLYGLYSWGVFTGPDVAAPVERSAVGRIEPEPVAVVPIGPDPGPAPPPDVVEPEPHDVLVEQDVDVRVERETQVEIRKKAVVAKQKARSNNKDVGKQNKAVEAKPKKRDTVPSRLGDLKKTPFD